MNKNNKLEIIKKLPLSILVIDYTRPGSDFFQSLLDGHPEILQVTGTSLYGFSEFWINANTDALDDLVNQFIYHSNHYQLFDSRFNITERWDKLGTNQDEFFTVDIQSFKKNIEFLMDGQTLTRLNFFYAVHGAYWMAQGRELSDVKMLFFHVHHLSGWDSYNEFPKPSVILMTRELRDGWVSYVENRPKTSSDYYDPRVFIPPISTYSNIFTRLMRYEKVIVIPLSKLHKEPDLVMKFFCKEYDLVYLPDVLLKSSYHGKLWWGDIWSKKRNGFNSSFGADKKWEPFFNNLDNIVLEAAFEPLYIDFSYSMKSTKFQRFFVLCFFPLFVLTPTAYEIKLLKFNFASRRRSKFKTLLLLLSMYLMRIKGYLKAFVNYRIRRKIITLHTPST